MPVLGEPLLEGLRDDLTDAVGVGQLLLRGLLDAVDGAELTGQRLGRDRAHVPDGEAGEDPGERALLGRGDVLQHGEGVLLRLALLVGEEEHHLFLAGLGVALGQARVLVEDVGLDREEFLDLQVEDVALVGDGRRGGSSGAVSAAAAT